MRFKAWLENLDPNTSPSLEVSPQEIQSSQEMWRMALDNLSYADNDMNLSLAQYVAHMVEMESPEEVGRSLGMALIHAPHYGKLAQSVDRNKVFGYLKQECPQAPAIIQAALRAYSTYEVRPFTMNTLKNGTR